MARVALQPARHRKFSLIGFVAARRTHGSSSRPKTAHKEETAIRVNSSSSSSRQRDAQANSRGHADTH